MHSFFKFIFIRYFIYIHFKCYPKSYLYPPPALLAYPPTPASWPWHSPILSFTIFHLTCPCSTSREFTFISGIRYRSEFIPLHGKIQFFLHEPLNRASFSHCVLFALCQKLVDCIFEFISRVFWGLHGSRQLFSCHS